LILPQLASSMAEIGSGKWITAVIGAVTQMSSIQ
jgi:hypothetical protein